MQLGMIGLGRMGRNMVRRLMRDGHARVVFDLNAQTVKQCEQDGAIAASSLDDLIQKITPPRAVWVMLPAGAATDETVTALAEKMDANDVIIDGGNSYFKDDIRRAKALKPKGLHYVDVGTSGGVWGVERGYCLTVGGEQEPVRRLDSIFRTLAPGKGAIPETPGREQMSGTAEQGYLHCGPGRSWAFCENDP